MSQLWWFSARSAGLVAWAALTASVVLGLLLATRVAGRRLRRPWLLDLHQWVSGIGAVAIGVHLLSVVADSYVHIGLLDLVVPFTSSWRPGALAWGVASVWLLVAVWITSLLRHGLAVRTWRGVHLASYLAYAGTTFHLLAAGTDTRSPVPRAVVLVSTAAIVSLTAVTLARALRHEHRAATQDAARAVDTTAGRLGLDTAQG
jgi:predicted ferric reductase